MSILGTKLTPSSGLGGQMSGGAYSSPSYGSNSTMVTASSTGGLTLNPIGGAQAGIGDIVEGKITLAAIEVIILALVGVYIWTHKIQGGG